MPGADFTSVSGGERLQPGERSAVRLELPMKKWDIGILKIRRRRNEILGIKNG